jgi:alpha-glucosidase
LTASQPWWQTGVFYQIYPRSFMDSTGDGVGDIPGILQRLDYLVELGVDALWISPIYPSPMADFGYDVSNYADIHPLFGDLATFKLLLDEAHQRKLRIVLDFVPNHTSNEHPWFIKSRSSRNNPYRNWYIWRDAKPDGSPPNNWESFFGGSAWQWDEGTQQYYLHQFLEKQPDLNWRNPAVVQAMHQVLRFWLDLGVDGFRIDVVHHLIKHPDFPDNPVIPNPSHNGKLIQLHRYDVALAEYYGKDLDELHIPFNFITMHQPWQAEAMRSAIRAYYAALPPAAMPNFVFGNHDSHRLATRYGPQNARSVGLLLLTLRGIPTMYNGDELGMQDIFVPPERLQDPVALRMPDTDEGRDPERAPMPWDGSPNAGFAPPGVQTWLPLPDNFRQINIAAQQHDSASTLNFYKRLLRLRRELPALQYGDLAFVDGAPPGTLVYTRQAIGQRMLVVINFKDQEQTLDLSSQGSIGEVLVSTQEHGGEKLKLSRLEIRANEGILFRI